MRIARSRWVALAIVLTGYQAYAQSFEGIDLTPTKKKPPVVAKPKPTELRISLGKEVQGAQLFIDKALVGELPMQPRAVTPGEHTFSIVRFGYKTVEHPITAARGKLTEVTVNLEAEGGIFTIGANEDGAQVAIDGAPAGAVPLQKVLAPGRHEIRVSKVGFTAHTQVVQAELGIEVTVAAELQSSLPGATAATDRPVQLALGPPDRDADLDVERGGAPAAAVSTGSPGAPLYKRWYVWAGAGAVIAGGVATAIVLSQPKTRPIDPVAVCGGPCDVVMGGP